MALEFEEALRRLAGTVTPEGPFSPIGAKPAPAAPAAAAPVAPAAPTTRLGKMGAQVPTLRRGVRSFGALLGKSAPVVGPAIAGIGEVTGIAESAADPEQSGVQTATRAAEGISRLAGMGAGTGLGFVGGGPFGALAGGALGYALPEAAFAIRDLIRGSARSPFTSAAAAPSVAAPAPATPTVLAPDAAFSPADQKPGFVGGFQEPASAPIRGYGANGQPYQPVTRTVGPDGTVSITGTGSPRFSSGTFSGFGAAPGSTFQPGALPGQTGGSVGNIAGNFMGALIGMKQVSGDNALKAAQSKAQMEALKAGSLIGLQSEQGAKARTEAQGLLARQALARVALQRGASEAEVASILSGRPVPSEQFTVPVGLGGMKPTDPSTVLNRRTGALTVTRPTQTAAKADFDADVKRLGSKERVLQEYARRNITPPAGSYMATAEQKAQTKQAQALFDALPKAEQQRLLNLLGQ